VNAHAERTCGIRLRADPIRFWEDPRDVIADPDARFFGAMLEGRSLMPRPGARIGPSTVRDWLRHFITPD
jgi:hypothetical protein